MFPIHDDNPTHRPPIVTVALIAACILIYFWQVSLGPQGGAQAVYSFGFIPALLFTDVALPPDLAVIPPSATLVSSMFLHGGFMHLAGNMLYLWVFGNNIEDVCGHGRFLAFYLACGVAAAFAQALPDPSSQIPMIGASGAISGVLGAYLLMYPHARVLVAIPFGFYLHMMRIPAGLVLVLWFGLQLLSNVMAQPGQGGVAFRAHIGGFIAGMILIPLFKQRRVRLRLPWG